MGLFGIGDDKKKPSGADAAEKAKNEANAKAAREAFAAQADAEAKKERSDAAREAGAKVRAEKAAALSSKKADPQLAVDGAWGQATNKALQSVLGVTVDGNAGPETVKAMQTRLNEGTF